jgi:hypothetical protein
MNRHRGCPVVLIINPGALQAGRFPWLQGMKGWV